jgi:hypothetical protein
MCPSSGNGEMVSSSTETSGRHKACVSSTSSRSVGGRWAGERPAPPAGPSNLRESLTGSAFSPTGRADDARDRLKTPKPEGPSHDHLTAAVAPHLAAPGEVGDVAAGKERAPADDRRRPPVSP